MGADVLAIDCSKCIHCEDIDLLHGIVVCVKNDGCTVISDCNGCADFSNGRNKHRDIYWSLNDYISSLADEEWKQIYREIEDYCERHIVPAKGTVLWRWIESERRRASEESR